MVNRAAVGTQLPGTAWRIPGYSRVNRGDILVFDPPHDPGLMLVKRLVGLPGDTLEMRNKELYLDGRRLTEAYVQHTDPSGNPADPLMAWQRDILAPGVDRGAYQPSRDDWGPLVIPQGRYFMLGDNRDESLDSRYWGLLEEWRIEGRVALIYFSYNKGSYRPFPWLREIRWGRIGDRP